MPPGRALDIGAGEGRNAIWLARAGWRVSAIDVSHLALGRAETDATRMGLALDLIVADWRDHKFAESSFDLVVMSFLHPAPLDHPTVLDCACRTLVPGGHLYLDGVDVADRGRRGPKDVTRLYDANRMRAELQAWMIVRCESVRYLSADGSATDVVAVARRPIQGR